MHGQYKWHYWEYIGSLNEPGDKDSLKGKTKNISMGEQAYQTFLSQHHGHLDAFAKLLSISSQMVLLFE